ncbi:hypothetical protein VTH06DRAFT_2909 [Thermothelomyces fergusii]
MDQVTQTTESLTLGDSRPNHESAGAASDPMAMLPELPPGRIPNSGMTVDETVAELSKHPLFMTELDDVEDNEHLAALQALAYEGTPLENAANFKEQGNECFREKRWADAKEFYGKGIPILVAEERRRAKGEKKKVKKTAEKPISLKPDHADASSAPDPQEKERQAENDGNGNGDDEYEEVDDDPAEVRSEQALLETLYVNRAACHLELRNYRSCTADCAAALRLNPRNIKAFYRSARGIRTRTTGRPPDMEDARVRLAPDEQDPASALVVPTLLLYPCHLETDFIKAFSERETLEQHFGYVFPLPWDRAGEYGPATVECFAETASGGLVKVGKKVPLLKVLSGGSVEIVDNLLKIFVVPKSRADAWVKEFKEKKATGAP